MRLGAKLGTLTSIQVAYIFAAIAMALFGLDFSALAVGAANARSFSELLQKFDDARPVFVASTLLGAFCFPEISSCPDVITSEQFTNSRSGMAASAETMWNCVGMSSHRAGKNLKLPRPVAKLLRLTLGNWPVRSPYSPPGLPLQVA